MDLGLQGRSVLITGASKGIGLATALSFAAEGVGHIHLNSRTEASLAEAREQIRAKHDVAVSIHPFDLSQSAQVTALADAVGEVDILVNNAGAIPRGSIEQITEETWRAAWDLKVWGFINLTRIYWERMKARGKGVIINDIGNAGARPAFGYIAGTAGNASLMAFTRGMGGWSLDHGVRVLGVNPGPILTERLENSMKFDARTRLGDETRWQSLMANFPAQRAGKVEEVADTIVFLASDRCGYTCGTIVTIDGGAMSRH